VPGAQRGGSPGAARPIRFGTSGWRGILGDEITEARAAVVAAAVADWLRTTRTTGPVVVVHDRRFGGARLVRRAAGVLEGQGHRTLRARGAVATPVAARAVLREGAAAALVFTASHNPPAHHGLKVLDRRGASAPVAATGCIERAAASRLGTPPPAALRLRGAARDLRTPYLAELGALLRREAFGDAGLALAYDAMHGAGAGLVDAALERLGVEVHGLRLDGDWGFGGCPPDPRPERLAALCARVRRERRLALGLATDGDADRYAVLDAAGRVLSESRALAVLVDHLARTGRVRRGVALSTATGSLVERVARSHGLEVERHPIGFKHLGDALAAGRVDAAGEESGGFALACFGHEKDGILAACLLAEAAAEMPLAARVRALERRHGPCAYGRVALAASPGSREALERLRRAPPRRVDGSRVRSVDTVEGLRLAFDDGFLMLRASGTEAVVRVYAEAPDAGELRRRLRLGRGWLDAAGARRVDVSPPKG